METQERQQRERHKLDIAGARALTMGAMLGVGIFLAPPQAAAALRDPVALIALWVIATLLALAGAIAYAQLAARDPRSGGDFHYLSEAYGPATARWASLFLILGGFLLPCAALGDALGRYQLPTFYLLFSDGPPPLSERTLGALCLAALGLLNLAGLRAADRFQRLSTRVPIYLLSLLSLITLIGVALEALPAPLPDPENAALSSEPLWAQGATPWVTAFLPIWFAFSGWNAPVYCAGEVRESAHTLPRAMSQGTVVIGALYTLIVIALIAGLGMHALANAGEAGSALAERIAGQRAAQLMSGLIALALLGTINATLIGGGRLLSASLLRRPHPTRSAAYLSALSALLILCLPDPGALQHAGLVMLLLGLLTLSTLPILWARDRREASVNQPRIHHYGMSAALIYGITGVSILIFKLDTALSNWRDPSLWLLLIFFLGLLLAYTRDTLSTQRS
ncbi:MAG: APC family permease [Myxococcota bacterium]|nr:APC family permease [Myxococcota bacterium]